MSNNKENLSKLLLFLDELLNDERNKWFRDELTKKIVSQFPLDNSLLSAININVDSIHKYLRLDVYPIIDYSNISDNLVRNQLIIDCLEMCRYRLGKVNNKIEFDEFCRFAHFQAEALVNFFFEKKFGDRIDEIKEFITENNPKYEAKEYHDNIRRIDFIKKLFAIKNKCDLSNRDLYFLLKVNEIRNLISHRPTSSKDEDNTLLKEKGELLKLGSYEINEENKSIYNQLKIIEFRRKADFSAVHLSLESLKSTILRDLNSEA